MHNKVRKKRKIIKKEYKNAIVSEISVAIILTIVATLGTVFWDTIKAIDWEQQFGGGNSSQEPIVAPSPQVVAPIKEEKPIVATHKESASCQIGAASIKQQRQCQDAECIVRAELVAEARAKVALLKHILGCQTEGQLTIRNGELAFQGIDESCQGTLRGGYRASTHNEGDSVKVEYCVSTK